MRRPTSPDGTPRRSWRAAAAARGLLPHWTERRWAAAAGAAALAVFAGYCHVVQGAVDRAARQHATVQARAHLAARCAALPDAAQRAACRERAAAGIVPPEPPLALAQSRPHTPPPNLAMMR